MKLKKSPKANLEKKRFIFFEIGLILSLSIIFCSFELCNDSKSNIINYNTTSVDIPNDIIATYRKAPEPIKLEPIEVKKEDIIESLNIVKDNEKETGVTFDSGDDKTFKNPTIYKPNDDPIDKDKLETIDYGFVETKPIFPGGEAALLKYISLNVDYPDTSVENGVGGIVYIKFIIDEKGHVINVELMNDVDPLINAEAIRVIKSLPDWKPGKQNNKNVPVSFIIPIKFILN
jgi:protein TonB